MIRLAVLAAALSFSLGGCALFGAVGALTIPEQVTVYAGMVTGAAALTNAGVNAVHTCRIDGGCKAVPVPP